MLLLTEQTPKLLLLINNYGGLGCETVTVEKVVEIFGLKVDFFFDLGC